MPRRPLLLTALVALAATASGQPPPGIAFDAPPPGTLSDRVVYVYGLAQDRAGYLWVASDDGLFRYDGVAFEPFRADPDAPGALPGNSVLSVAVADDGAVWASVDRFGLVRVAPGGVERVPLAVSGRRHVSIAGAGAGSLWLRASSEDGAEWYRFDPAARRLHRVRGVESVVVAGGDVVGRTAGAVVRYDGGRWRTVWDGPTVADVGGDRAGFLDADGRVHVVTGGRSRVVGRVPAGERRGLFLDRRGTLWSGLAGSGARALDLATGAETVYRHDPARPETLPDTEVAGFFEDAEGALWLRSRLGVRVVPPGWSAFRSSALPPTDFAHVVAASRPGRVWAGRACDAFDAVAADGSRTPMRRAAPAVARALAATGLCAVSILEAADGTVWLPGWPARGETGLLEVRPDGRWTHHRATGRPGALPSGAMRVVHQDAGGRVWVGTEGGLAEALGGAFRTVPTDPGDPGALDSPTIWALADAPDGHLWVGTYTGGLSRLDPATGRVVRTFRADPDDPGALSSDVVTVVHPSRADPGVVWVGTYDGGLSRLDVAAGRFRRWTRADGLPDLAVKSILEDDAGDLWIGTNAGLARLRTSDGRLTVYTEADGLPGVAFGLYDAAVLPGGRFAFAVGNALVTFDPASVERAAFRAPVVLRGVRIDGLARRLPADGGPIRLAPGERALGVEVAALSFSAPERTRYEARLDGLDREWVDLGSDRSASWAGLPPGAYTLRVRAGTASGAWSPAELAVPVVVAPLWWQRAWVQAAAALALLGGFAAAVVAVSQRRLRGRLAAAEREAESEKRVRHERERISRDLHDHVGAQLSSLLAGVEIAKLSRGAAPGADPLAGVEQDARETMRQLRETIWTLHGEALAPGAFCDRVEADARRRARGDVAVEVSCGLDADRTLAPTVALELFRIAQEAVTNTLKHAGASRLAVSLDEADGQIVLEVSDDGAWVAPSGGDGLSGFGLGSMRARAEGLGGTLSVETASGTTVRVSVPAGARLPASGEAR